MTREEAAKIFEKQFDESCGDYRYQNKDKLDYEDALWLAITALRQREEFTPPCYKPDSGDGECAYQIYGPDDDEPIERCKACPLCYSDKMRHHGPKTPCDLCLYNPPSSGGGKPCTMCPASSLPEPPGKPAEEKHGCDFAKQMGFVTCDKYPIDCDIRQMPKEGNL